MPARIGGNLEDIARTAGVMTETGGAASSAGQQTAAVAAQMEAELDGATTTLRVHVERVAEDLRGRILAARERLGATDWEGQSRVAADAAEQRLSAEVDRVLAAGLANVETFKALVLARADEFVAQVHGEFQTVLADVDASYAGLAQGSRAFAEQLDAADRTISFGAR